ncbi:hypothetical protein NMY22_g18846 [Coprinellus aureogranulatus]|nr:hypothetical protein NMY22_g18846 [Coprinellus aureogranulatus]
MMTHLDRTSTLALRILGDVEPKVVFPNRCMIKNSAAEACAHLGVAIDVTEVGAAVGVRGGEGLSVRVAQHKELMP